MVLQCNTAPGVGREKMSQSRSAVWLDDTLAAGERTDGAHVFNVLLRHETLVRTCNDLEHQGSSAVELAAPLSATTAGLAALLHDRVSVHVREGFEDRSRELSVAHGKRAVLESRMLLPSHRALRMEPAELLPSGETRVHWRDMRGVRHGMDARWSVEGLALRIILVTGSSLPPTHREWVEALRQRSPSTSSLLAPDVVLHDIEDGSAGGGMTVGSERVLPRLLRWSAAAVAGGGAGGGGGGGGATALTLSRTTHLPGNRTRISIAGRWPMAAGGPAALSLLQETIEWRPVKGKRAGARRQGGGWAVQQIWRRVLAMPNPGSTPLPMEIYRAAALAGSTAVLCGPHVGDDDGFEAADGRSRGGSSSVVGRSSVLTAHSEASDEGDGADASKVGLLTAPSREPLKQRAAAQLAAKTVEGRAEAERRKLEARVAAAVATARLRDKFDAMARRLRARRALMPHHNLEPAALSYAGVLVLRGADERSGELFDTLEEAARLVRLQAAGGSRARELIEEMIDDDVEYVECSGHAGAPPSATVGGRARAFAHLSERELPRARHSLISSEPAALLLDGRTATGFELRVAPPSPPDRLMDVLSWSESGKVTRWVRVVEPHACQRDWLQLLAKGRGEALGGMLRADARLDLLDGPTPRRARGDAEASDLVASLALRMHGKVHHIGRSRQIGEWAWPDDGGAEAAAGPGEGARRGRRGAPAPPPTIWQAIVIGAWRPHGGKWYAEEEAAMRETALWVGNKVSRLVWERLPPDHPQAAPVWERWRMRQRRAAKAAREAKLKLAMPARDPRPAWSDEPLRNEVPRSRKGLVGR